MGARQERDVVHTFYRLTGETSWEQVVETVEASRYPVVADPWLWKSLIRDHDWVSNSQGLTMRVFPTTWGRAGVWVTVGVATYPMVRRAFWEELKGRSPRVMPHTSSMRDQLYCHIDFVRLRYPRKKSWNLDTWRPNVSYKTMIAKRCNP